MSHTIECLRVSVSQPQITVSKAGHESQSLSKKGTYRNMTMNPKASNCTATAALFLSASQMCTIRAPEVPVRYLNEYLDFSQDPFCSQKSRLQLYRQISGSTASPYIRSCAMPWGTCSGDHGHTSSKTLSTCDHYCGSGKTSTPRIKIEATIHDTQTC